jgi:hypothetical protein
LVVTNDSKNKNSNNIIVLTPNNPPFANSAIFQLYNDENKLITDDDIVWVEEDIGDNCVRVRYVKEGEKINTGTLKQQLKHREHFI